MDAKREPSAGCRGRACRRAWGAGQMAAEADVRALEAKIGEKLEVERGAGDRRRHRLPECAGGDCPAAAAVPLLKATPLAPEVAKDSAQDPNDCLPRSAPRSPTNFSSPATRATSWWASIPPAAGPDIKMAKGTFDVSGLMDAFTTSIACPAARRAAEGAVREVCPHPVFELFGLDGNDRSAMPRA